MQPVSESAVPESNSIVDIAGLVVEFGSGKNKHVAVDGVDLQIGPSEVVAVVGESGSGKSTLVSAILGLLPSSASVTSGTIRVDGSDTTSWKENDWRTIRGRRIGLVPQDPMSNLDPVLRIGHQVDEAVRAHRRLPRAEVHDETASAFTRAGLPGAERRKYPHQFSGGMRQRALIAMASVNSPALLIADEPTSALDVTVQRRILDNLAEVVAGSGAAILLVTHDLALAAERADRIVVMRHGRVVESGTAAAVFGQPEHDYTRALLASVPSARPVREAATPAEASIVLEVRNLSKSFGGVPAVDDVSFVLERGKTLALVGESGSGKSTTAWSCLGLNTPSAGRVFFEGTDVASLKGRELRAFRRRVQPIFQDPYASLDPTYTVDRIVREPLSAFGIGDRSSRKARAAELLDLVGLAAATLRRRPSELSGGQRQRVAIARALAAEPELIVCDEPVSALDVLVQAQVLDLLQTLQTDLGLTYLFISHDLGVVRRIADDVAVMTKGKIVEYGSTTTVFDNPQHDYTRELLGAVPGLRVPIEV